MKYRQIGKIRSREYAIIILKEIGIDTSTKGENEINEPIKEYLGIDYSVKDSDTIDCDKIVVPEDTDFSESHIGPTPNGGAYSTIFFFNDKRIPCTRDNAHYMNIIEYSLDGEIINETVAFKNKSDSH